MIRVFNLFRKLNFLSVSAKDFFVQGMVEFNPHGYRCPVCKAEHNDWVRHATYERCLVSFENEHTVTYHITVVRYKCPSCNHTHAILPESIIPYHSYSFLFILAVMKDYFTKSITVENICIKYGIAVSTLYSWKELFLRHKKIWLGLLDNACTSSLRFLNSLFEGGLVHTLKEFFLMTGISFLQSTDHIKKAHWAME